MTEMIFRICKEFTSEQISSSKSLVKCPVWSSSTEDSSPGIRNIKSEDQKCISVELMNMSCKSLVLIFKNYRDTEGSHRARRTLLTEQRLLSKQNK